MNKPTKEIINSQVVIKFGQFTGGELNAVRKKESRKQQA